LIIQVKGISSISILFIFGLGEMGTSKTLEESFETEIAWSEAVVLRNILRAKEFDTSA